MKTVSHVGFMCLSVGNVRRGIYGSNQSDFKFLIMISASSISVAFAFTHSSKHTTANYPHLESPRKSNLPRKRLTYTPQSISMTLQVRDFVPSLHSQCLPILLTRNYAPICIKEEKRN